MNDPAKPLWVQSDRTVLFEVDHASAEEVQRFLPRFAELEKSPERFHTYRITPLSLWNAASVGVSAAQINSFLRKMSKTHVPQNVTHDVDDFMRRYGLLKLVRRDGALVLESRDPLLLADLARGSVLEPFLKEAAADCLVLNEESRGDVKLGLLRIGYPVQDMAGYTPGTRYPFSLRKKTASGLEFAFRTYQKRAAEMFYAGGSEHGGSGVIVLPCGAGKTVVGMGVINKVQAQTLILTTNTVAVRQWRSELLDKTNVPDADIGEYTGQKKQIRPITISTYQILTHRKKKGVTPFTHFGLFDANDWGLIIYDEVHLLPAPVFRATADIQARRRLGLTATLVREDQREEDVFSLIGPKRFDMPWRDLEKDGWIATAECVEVRIPLPREERMNYLSLPSRERFRVASENPDKVTTLEDILKRHPDGMIVVIGQYLDQIATMAARINAPLITGKTPVSDRELLYRQFRNGEIRVLVVSKVGNFAIDLPDASVAVQVSGTFGSRQEEAQRLGRILRPKSDGRPARFYSLVSRDTKEEEYAQKRQRFLTERGYAYRICEPAELAAQSGPVSAS